MTERSTEHTTFVLERRYAASPARVFAAWADPVQKAQWLSWEILILTKSLMIGSKEEFATD